MNYNNCVELLLKVHNLNIKKPFRIDDYIYLVSIYSRWQGSLLCIPNFCIKHDKDTVLNILLMPLFLLVPISVTWGGRIPHDQNSSKCCCTGNIQNCAYWRSASLLYENISHTHLTYDNHSKYNWNKYIEGFCLWNWLIPATPISPV